MSDERMVFLRGRSNQDMALEDLRRAWEKTHPEVQEYLLNWLSCTDADSVRRRCADLPDMVIMFFQNAAICGIREAVLQHVTVQGEGNSDGGV